MDNWIAPKSNLLPDFIIGGAMKSGTSTLHAILDKHPSVFIPSSEIGFFDIDNILQHSDFNFYIDKKWVYQSMDKNPKIMWDWYQDKFKNANSRIKGEDSTTYLPSRLAAERISIQEKPIKLIFLLRQPTLRSYSNYWHFLRTGRATYSFEDTLRYNPYGIINRSLYKEQIENYYRFIPRSRIKIVLFENLISEPEATLKEICLFLNINYDEFPEDILSTHANKANVPNNGKLEAHKNRLFREFGNIHYLNSLPYKFPKMNKTTSLYARIFNRAFSILNPHLEISPPKINSETKLFLDKYFYNELQGIDELINQKVLPKWFPNSPKD